MTQGSILEVSPKLLGGIKKKATESTNNKGVVSVFCKILHCLCYLCERFSFSPKREHVYLLFYIKSHGNPEKLK